MQLTQSKGFAPATLGEAMKFSEMLSASQMVPRQYQGKPQDILVAVQWGYEIGLAPMQALQNISVINGKPSVYGDAALALVQASPVCEDIQEYMENEDTDTMVAVCVAKRKGRTPVTGRFSIDDAKRAGLWGKQGPWVQYTKRMLQMRARGFALRDAFPDVLKGLITAEEAMDYPEQEAKDVTPPRPSNPLDALAPPAPIAATPTPIEAAVATVVEEVEELPSGDTAPASVWILSVPGKPEQQVEDADSWVASYLGMVEKVAKAGKASAQKRLDALAALKNSNDSIIKNLTTEKRMSLTASMSKFIGPLKDAAAVEK
jgi:hypothetical protein